MCVNDQWLASTYGVGDDEDVGLGSVVSSSLGKVADNGGVGVEEVITGHTGLSGDTGRNEDDIATLQGIGKTGRCGLIASDCALGVDVGDISSNTYASIIC